jgi:hypothetical protein
VGLPALCPVPVFESVFVVPVIVCRHCFCPRIAAGWRAVPRSAALAGSFLLPDGFRGCGRGYEKRGANTVTWGFPVTVCLVAVVCRNFGAF